MDVSPGWRVGAFFASYGLSWVPQRAFLSGWSRQEWACWIGERLRVQLSGPATMAFQVVSQLMRRFLESQRCSWCCA